VNMFGHHDVADDHEPISLIAPVQEPQGNDHGCAQNSGNVSQR
jgi:hypothetical protein